MRGGRSVSPRTDPVARRIAEWGSRRDDVRAVLLTSSRTRQGAPVDDLSDWDVTLYATDPGALLGDDGWLWELGDVLVRLPVPGMAGGWDAPTRLALYRDGTKIDFTVKPVVALAAAASAERLPAELDAGYRVLLDKDGAAAGLGEPTGSAYRTALPTQRQLTALVEEFWWEATYVARNLARDELLPARYSLECVMKLDLLKRALEWRVAADAGEPVRVGVLGRGLRSRLPAEIWARLERTYLGPSPEEGWTQLERTARLFRDVTMDLAERLGLDAPRAVEEGVWAYVERLRSR